MRPLFKHSPIHVFFPPDPQGPDIDAQSCSLVYQVLGLKRRELFFFVFGEGGEIISTKEPHGQTKIFHQANLDANFEDRNAFVTGMAKFDFSG